MVSFREEDETFSGQLYTIKQVEQDMWWQFLANSACLLAC